MSINRIGGLATGLDTQKMIQDLVKTHRKPVDRLRQERQVLEWRREDYRGINSALLAFRNKTVFPMQLDSTFLAKTVASSNPAAVTATATPAAANADYAVTVTFLATTAYKTSVGPVSASSADKVNPEATLWSQRAKFFDTNFRWNPDGHTFDFSLTTFNHDGTANNKVFTVDAHTETLNGVLARISADKALGLTVFYEHSSDRVSISTTRTGDNNAAGHEIGVGTTGFLAEVLRLGTAAEQGGTSARATLNGLEVTRPTNDFTLNNVHFSLKATGNAALSVRGDTASVLQQIKGFVNAYNGVLDLLNGKLREERFRDYPPLLDNDPVREHMTDKQVDQWEQKARSGLLRHDSILSGIVSRLRADVFTPVAGLSASLNHLTHIGITPGSFADQGRLVIDEARLRQAIDQDPDGVARIFNQSGATNEERGIGHRLYGYLDASVKQLTTRAGSSTQTSSYDPSWIGRKIGGLDERIQRAEERLQHLEDRYWKQFTALEQAISRMNTQSAWLAQQFGG